MKIMQKIKRDLNGSFTVEAALLMTVLIPLLTALIYLGFYQHDKVWIANKTRTEAMEAALDPDRKNQTDWSGVLASHVRFQDPLHKPLPFSGQDRMPLLHNPGQPSELHKECSS